MGGMLGFHAEEVEEEEGEGQGWAGGEEHVHLKNVKKGKINLTSEEFYTTDAHNAANGQTSYRAVSSVCVCARAC